MKIVPFFMMLTEALSLSLNSTIMNKYNEFIHTYDKSFSYDNFEIFKKNVNYIDTFNQQNHSYALEVNQFADNPGFDYSLMHTDDKKEYYEFKGDIVVPQSVDWREKNAVTDVKNQGHCGGCWAFSTTGSVEGIVAIKTGNLLNISEQQLIDCSSNEGNHGCEGGIMQKGFEYIINNNGICSEEEYPYQGIDGTCQDCKTIVEIKNYGDIYPNNEKILKRAVAQQPVSVAIQANLTSFQLYSSGIYSDPACGTELDHGVLIIGYGTDYDLNMDYWLVKNSWGPKWGENGYIRILRNYENKSGLCGIAMLPSIPLL